jgi:hypothetical protein
MQALDLIQRAALRHEPITNSVDGQEMTRRGGIRLKLPPKTAHVRIHHSGETNYPLGDVIWAVVPLQHSLRFSLAKLFSAEQRLPVHTERRPA